MSLVHELDWVESGAGHCEGTNSGFGCFLMGDASRAFETLVTDSAPGLIKTDQGGKRIQIWSLPRTCWLRTLLSWNTSCLFVVSGRSHKSRSECGCPLDVEPEDMKSKLWNHWPTCTGCYRDEMRGMHPPWYEEIVSQTRSPCAFEWLSMEVSSLERNTNIRFG